MGKKGKKKMKLDEFLAQQGVEAKEKSNVIEINSSQDQRNSYQLYQPRNDRYQPPHHRFDGPRRGGGGPRFTNKSDVVPDRFHVDMDDGDLKLGGPPNSQEGGNLQNILGGPPPAGGGGGPRYGGDSGRPRMNKPRGRFVESDAPQMGSGGYEKSRYSLGGGSPPKKSRFDMNDQGGQPPMNNSPPKKSSYSALQDQLGGPPPSYQAPHQRRSGGGGMHSSGRFGGGGPPGSSGPGRSRFEIGGPSPNELPQNPPFVLLVTNLPYNIEDEAIYASLPVDCKVEEIERTRRGQAKINFSDRDSAKSALELHNTKIGDRTVRLVIPLDNVFGGLKKSSGSSTSSSAPKVGSRFNQPVNEDDDKVIYLDSSDPFGKAKPVDTPHL